MKYKISVILPIFNVETYIRESLESIVEQTIGFENIEVIMVDDCSSDKSGEIIDEYSSKYDNFNGIHLNENSGPEKARNVGIENSTADYLMFLDPDDFYSGDICETLYNKIIKENVDMVFCNFNFYSNLNFKKYKSIFGSQEIKVDSIDENPKLLCMHPSIWTKIYKKEFIFNKDIKFNEDVRAGDRVFVLRTFLEANGIIYLQNYYGTNYRVNLHDRNSFSNQISKEILMGRIRGYAEIYNILKEYKKEEYFPLIFDNIREFWTDLFIKSEANPLEKNELLKGITFLFKEFDKYEIPVNSRKKYLIPLFNCILQEEYEDAILIADDLKEFIEKFEKIVKDENKLNKNNFPDRMMNIKKIFSITMVKNEMDIIESFIRYNTNIFDGMIILDNGSTDYTPIILSLLENEGLPIYLFDDKDSEFDKIAKMNMLLKKAVEEYDADIVIPLDADEFIISNKGGNPRKFLEKFESNSYYSVMWKTYIPFLGNKENEKFIPSKITYSRDEQIEKMVGVHTKVVIPQNLVNKYKVRVDRGSHNLNFKSDYKEQITRVYDQDLRIAHFPIRSIEQLTSKVSVGWLNALSSVELRKTDSHHWKKMFNQLKRNGRIKKEDALKFAFEYALSKSTLADLYENNVEITAKEDPMDLSFNKNINCIYYKNLNPMSNLLEACENLSLGYVNLKKEFLNGNVSKNKNRYELNNQTNKRPLKQRLFSVFPSLYFLLHNNHSIKLALINIKGYKAIKENNLMDINYYLKNNGDVRVSGADPIIHYIYHGFKEGRKPNPTFDGDRYLKMHSDVKNSNINPLVHYSLYGMEEERKVVINKEIEDKNNIEDFPQKNMENDDNNLINKNKKISIKVPAPNWKVAHTWGDYHFALALKKEFEKDNYETVIHMADQWDQEDDADIVLVLRGRVKYNPKPNNFNIMWNISHPEMVSLEEYNEYDYIFIASNKWADEIKNKVNVPVESLLQCTDPDLFYNELSKEYEHDLLFVGNNRKNVVRKIIKDLLPTERDFCLYGDHWDGKIESKYYYGNHIDNKELHKAYSSSKILLNDHWDDMRENGFISNRIFDGFAAGAFIISDEIKGVKEIFGDSLATYSNREDLNNLIDYYLNNHEEREKIIEDCKNIVLKNHTFENRAKRILEIIPNNLEIKNNKKNTKIESFLIAFGDVYWENQEKTDQSLKRIEENQKKIVQLIKKHEED
ncbi:glycosyltransferase [Methanobacterium sp. SMA-27]|uniref:glycosyltransferase n=1 Tax=Methanobacterium sp. SMA-27 TaxID=1495336 RepID=UPI00064E77D1|nr:glycosyltransferase [Methanobacterium sp. SMA-27]